MKTMMKWMMAIGILAGTTLVFANDDEGRGRHRGDFKEKMEEKRAEHREFMESIRDLPDDEKLAAIKEHMAEQHAERTERAKERHAEIKERISEKLSQHENIPEGVADGFLDFIEDQMKENLEFREEMYKAAVDKLEDVFADDSLEGKDRHEAMKTFHKEMREKAKAHHESQKDARREKREELFGDLKLGPGDGEGRGRRRDAEES